MWKETMNRLDFLAREVREGKSVMEAANFARWLEFSGFIKVFELYPSDEKYLTVSAVAVRQKIAHLLDSCVPWFTNGKVPKTYSESDIGEINRKIDTLTMLIQASAAASDSSVLFQSNKKSNYARGQLRNTLFHSLK
jgi:protoheme ferro-lyase